MRWHRACLAALVLGLAACSKGAEEPVPVIPDQSLTRPPQAPQHVELAAPVVETRDRLIKAAKVGSLSRMARIAAESDQFVSNFSGESHRDFWDLLNRTGLDPTRKLRQLFEEPAGVRMVDGERWYVWPDLAALDAADLIPEKLSFRERRRLRELIGEDGIALVRQGRGYPGMRTAIAEDGRWLYFVLGLDGED